MVFPYLNLTVEDSVYNVQRIESTFILLIVSDWLVDKTLADKQWGFIYTHKQTKDKLTHYSKSLIGWRNISWHAIISCQLMLFVSVEWLRSQASFVNLPWNQQLWVIRLGEMMVAGGLGNTVWSIYAVTFDDAGSWIQLVKWPVWIWRNISWFVLSLVEDEEGIGRTIINLQNIF